MLPLCGLSPTSTPSKSVASEDYCDDQEADDEDFYGNAETVQFNRKLCCSLLINLNNNTFADCTLFMVIF